MLHAEGKRVLNVGFKYEPMHERASEVCGSPEQNPVCGVLWLCGSLGREPRQGASINKRSLMPQLTRLKHSSAGGRHFLSPTNYRDT